MKNTHILSTTILIMLAIAATIATAAPAATLTTITPASLKEFELGSLNITITTNETFNGTISIEQGNFVINPDVIIIADTDFDSNNTAKYSLEISSDIPGANTIKTNLTTGMTIIDSKQNSIMITDGTPPAITLLSPSGDLNSQTIVLSAYTDENAECRYSVLDQEYDIMQAVFSSGFSIAHTATATFSDGPHTVYVRCNDTNANAMQMSETTSFTITTTPTADITINKKSPLTAGIMEVTLITNKNMDDVTLSYAFSDAPTTMNSVPLAGSGTMWTGYFIVPETSVTRVGTFTFLGTDTDGRTGTRINSGKLFIVDTSKPKEITDISATGETNRIKLKWFYDGETGKFNVYKSESSDVSYVDLYEITNESFFSDKNVNPDKEYYYRVAAVTSSGNVGPLSSIVSAQAEKIITTYGYPDQTTQTTPAQPIPEEIKENTALVLRKITERIKEISILLIDVEKAEKDLASIDDPIEKAAIDDLGLVEKISAEKAGLVEIKNQYEGYKTNYIDETEFNRTNEFINVKIKKAKVTIPKKIIVLDKSTFIQQTDYEDIVSASNSVLNESQVKIALSANKQLNDDVKVEVDYKAVELTFLDDSADKRTIIRKSASYQSAESAKKIMLVETIPKTIALSTNDITFNTKYIKVIKNDPIVGLELDELNYNPSKIIYVVSGKKEIDEIKKTKTIAISLLTGTNKLTGMNIFSIEGNATMFDWIVLAGVVLLIALIGYYFMFVREQPLLVDRKEMHGLLPQDNTNQNQATNKNNSANNSSGNSQSNNQSYGQNMQNNPSGPQSTKQNQMLIAEMSARNLPAKENISVPSRINTQTKTMVRTEEIRRIVNEGHFHIDNLNYNAANQMYQQAISMLDSSSTPMHERIEMDTTINALYNKLLLMSKINEAHNSLDKNDKVSAMTLLDEIAGLNNEVIKRSSNTNLAEYSLNWQNKLQKRIFGR